MPNVLLLGKFYTAHEDVASREKSWLNQLKIEIEEKSDKENNLLINLTWFGVGEKLLQIIKTYNPCNTNIWLSASIDGINWMYNSTFIKTIHDLGFTIYFVGFGPNYWNSWMPKWIYDNNFSTDVDLKQNFSYKFLSYNRKPKLHRLEFVSKFLENNLISDAFVTFEYGHFKIIDNLTSNTDQELHTNDTRFTRPEDMCTLGNLDIWTNSFCVLVTETEINDPWQISEKTWKPIFGKRPFMLVGHKNLENILEKLEIYNPSNLFEYKFDGIDSIINYCKILNSYSHTKLYEFYLKLLPKLEHNRKKVIELATKSNIL